MHAIKLGFLFHLLTVFWLYQNAMRPRREPGAIDGD
jgi:hypothetical protein